MSIFILILDNAPTHPSSTELNEIDPQFFVVYLAPDVTPLIQPMDQGVISALKRPYKTMFLNELLAKEFKEKGSVDEFIKKMESPRLSICYRMPGTVLQ
ncbi:hypothetical protein NQ318_004861 [Aromia moschata]|uniref:DDE-1 domain-containing protein n=1 Tax=Aromia moschata TaxID=1265417 RepID=A0AAV8Z1U3_9CUCU|nr:hypothetical protein NQ318_004861 [Aromia moschata]